MSHAGNEANKLKYGSHNRGVLNALSKLSEDDVHIIRSLQGRLSHRAIASRFGVSERAIRSIHSGRTWAWLPYRSIADADLGLPLKEETKMVCECRNHAWRPLKYGHVVLVSAEDESILDLNWHVKRMDRAFYVARNLPRVPNKPTQEKLHRVITNPPSELVVDHINSNGLDNRRENLRVCTQQQNSFNQRLRRTSSMPFKGVFRCYNKFGARITVDGKSIHLGMYKTPEDAHQAYIEASERLHGSFGRAA